MTDKTERRDKYMLYIIGCFGLLAIITLIGSALRLSDKTGNFNATTEYQIIVALLLLAILLPILIICIMVAKLSPTPHDVVIPLFFAFLIIGEFAFEMTNNTIVWILVFPAAVITSLLINFVFIPQRAPIT